MRWLSVLVTVAILTVASPVFASSCDDVSVNVGRELPFGLAVAQNLHQVFCQMKKAAPQTIYSFDYSTGSWCSARLLTNIGWKTSDYESLRDLFDRSTTALQKQLAQIDKDVRPNTAACYNFNPSVARLVDVVRDVGPLDLRLTTFTPSVRFYKFEFLGVQGTLQPLFGVNRAGVASLIDNLQHGNAEATIQLDGTEYSVATSLVGAEFISTQLKDPAQLSQMRREALPFFKRVLSTYPGAISQQDNADLVIDRHYYTMRLSFNEATGVISINVSLNPALQSADYIADQETIERMDWLPAHIVRSR